GDPGAVVDRGGAGADVGDAADDAWRRRDRAAPAAVEALVQGEDRVLEQEDRLDKAVLAHRHCARRLAAEAEAVPAEEGGAWVRGRGDGNGHGGVGAGVTAGANLVGAVEAVAGERAGAAAEEGHSEADVVAAHAVEEKRN